ncbi:MAG TPA: phenylacetate--CoA ligase family protein [Thermoanaerobaculia bacterium]|nr:phenylacetate--CoA ligase family protein [Thermoanaerobaculia bacterium]
MKQGPAAIAQRRRSRFEEMAAFARAHSPYYRELYRDLPREIDDAALLPVTDKKRLMARFDDWVTDPEVTLEKVRALAENPDRIAERFLGKYTVATTSGTTGARGMFVLDDRTMAVTNAIAFRMITSWLGVGDVLRIFAHGGRMAMIMAGGGHFASAVAAARMRKSPRGRKRVGVFPAQTPLPVLVEQLNRFQPAVMAPYASMAALLASEQEAGRLAIHPVLLALSAEGLPIDEYARIAKAFDARVGNSYASTECTFLSYGCEERWLHINADWVVVEPVNAEYQPVPAGEQSYTVLISNLANRVQPILRYDLGDSVLQRPDPCPCGNPLPAIRVQGRAADVLTFERANGQQVSIPPLAFAAVTERVDDIELSQIVQTGRAALRVRLRLTSDGDSDRIWRSLSDALTRLLAEHDLSHVRIERASEPPEQSTGGKFRQVIPLKVTEQR